MKNVGSIDKILRIVVGVAIMGAGYYFKNWWGAIGIVPVVTALLGWCPAYTLLGIKTCPTKPSK
ncbi:MAG: DUF2892 domain-containing protein [Thiotrichaceae bacterium]